MKVSIPGTEEEAIAAVRTQLFSIEKACKEHYGIEEFEKISTILSGPGNFRDSIATVFPYKGNRDSSHKPYWYQSIRNYLTSEWGARVVHGREADDECSILARRDRDAGNKYCIATIDKDLDQIPGDHYNYLKQVNHCVSVGDAERWFWQQCLSGDATDGVPGCYKLGSVGAERIIADIDADYAGAISAGPGTVPKRAVADVKGELSSGALGAGTASGGDSSGSSIQLSNDSGTTAARSPRGRLRRSSASTGRGIWSTIVSTYEASKAKAGCPYVGRDAEAIALESARLVYLQQIEGELWTPPGEPKKYLPGYEPETDDE